MTVPAYHGPIYGSIYFADILTDDGDTFAASQSSAPLNLEFAARLRRALRA
jgi:hypothetical protein